MGQNSFEVMLKHNFVKFLPIRCRYSNICIFEEQIECLVDKKMSCVPVDIGLFDKFVDMLYLINSNKI